MTRILLLGIFALNVLAALGTNQHLICKTVEDVFTDGSTQGHTSTTPRLLHGSPGKRGPKGVKGEPGIAGLKGEKGSPGVVDPKNIENVVEEKLREANKELVGRIEKLERHMAKIDSSIADIAPPVSCDDGFVYGRKCYFVISKSGVHYEPAKILCVEKGGTAANIVDRDHQDLVVEYMRSKKPPLTELWLGMTYTHSTSTMRWLNGEEVPKDVADSISWWTGGGYPRSSPGNDKISIGAQPTSFGFFNSASTYTGARGVLCEM